MTPRCRSTLAPLAKDGYSHAARCALADGARLPTRLALDYPATLAAGDAATRLSISGVQEKLSLVLVDGAFHATETGGTYILKPVPRLNLPRFQSELPANEHVTMQIATQVYGIVVAPCALLSLTDDSPAYLTRRFDRTSDGGQRSMEDFCSLAAHSPETHGRNFKYDGSYQELGELLRRHCPAYRIEIEKLYRLLCFNYLIGNGDAHLKNFSLIPSADGDPILSPAYDLLCTTLHLPNESRLALDFFAADFETEAFAANGFRTAADFATLAERFGIAQRRAARIYAEIVDDTRFHQLAELVQRSFLSSTAQSVYLDIAADRRRALRIGWE